MRNVHRYLCPCLLAAALLSGCGDALDGGPAPLGPPLTPLPDEGAADLWYRTWAYEPDLADAGAPQDMLVLYTGSGRTWREGPGPNGYAVRLVLLDADSRPVRHEGQIRAVLVARPDDPSAEPLMAWSLDERQTDERFRGGRLPGYLLQLDWGDRRPAGGTYMLIFRYRGADGDVRLTRNIVFEDYPHDEYSIQPSAPPPAAVQPVEPPAGQPASLPAVEPATAPADAADAADAAGTGDAGGND